MERVIGALVVALALALAPPMTFGSVDGVRVVGETGAPAAVRGEDRSFARDVEWSTAPPVGARLRLEVDPARARVIARAGADPLVVAGAHGIVIAALADDPSNAALVRWGYWGYLAFSAARRARDEPEVAFADWAGAPVPGRGLTLAWLMVTVMLALALGLAFARARHRARARSRDDAAQLLAPLTSGSAPAASGRDDASARAWTRPGFARPLGGFFLFLSATLLALGPYIYVTAVWVPARIQPFPEVDGAWAPVEEVALLLWALADLGLTSAFVQRFARDRAAQPGRALAAAQLYAWWQLASGVLLFAAGGALACLVLPHTRYALLARVVLLRAAIQLFSVFGVFTTFFQAAQRFDYALGLDLLDSRLLLVALPIPCVVVGRALGHAHPALGETGGALVGIAAGTLAAHVVTFALGLGLYRRLGLALAPLFSVTFDRRTLADLLKFGLGVVAGKAPFYVASAVEVALATTLLAGYPAWLGVKGLIATKLVFVIYFAYPFFDSAIPALAEALGAGKRALARYYVLRYLQFGNLFTAVVVAFLVGAVRPLAAGALGPEWRPVAEYLPLAAGIALLLPITWISDSLEKGAGRPGLDAAILTGEQVLRVALLGLFLPRVGFVGFYLASLGSIVAKNLVAWPINHARILRLELRAWSTFGAPLLAGAALFAVLHLAALLLPGATAARIAILATAALAAFPFGFVACGLLGGFDPAALDEIETGASLAGPMRRVARLLAWCARTGARVAPVRARAFPLARAAAAEADALARRD